ncbi:MAG: hypothetical protein IJH91_05425 [Mogibacterium sp.]|nr:hypothetical protein [Mogibacterium sp.]
MILYVGCALTVALETLFFLIAGYGRRRYFMLLCVAVNVATNLALNLTLMVYRTVPFILALEVVVVLVEYAVYAAAEGRSRRLLLLTLGANLTSFLTGVLLFGLE